MLFGETKWGMWCFAPLMEGEGHGMRTMRAVIVENQEIVGLETVNVLCGTPFEDRQCQMGGGRPDEGGVL